MHRALSHFAHRTRLRRHRRRSNWRRDGEGLFAEVLTEFLVDGEYFGEYLCPPQPPDSHRPPRSLDPRRI